MEGDEMRHTKEPWQIRTIENEHSNPDTRIVNNEPDPWVIAEIDMCCNEHDLDDIHAEPNANAQRIVACVNALASVEDVEKWMAKLHEHLIDLKKWSEAWQVKAECSAVTHRKALEASGIGIEEIISSALSLFPKEPESE